MNEKQQPIENPALVAAMDRVASSPTDSAKDELLAQLQRATFLGAAFTSKMKFSRHGNSDTGTIEQGSQIEFLSAALDGKNYLPLFTDWRALRAYTDQKVSGFVFPAADAWVFALQGFDAVVINPAHNALPLDREILQYLSQTSKTGARWFK